MKQQNKHFLFGAALLGVLILGPSPGVVANDQIRIPMPPMPPMPKIVLPAPPPMIWLPTPKVYVAHKSPYPIFFDSGHYYLQHHDSWYIGPGYAGPWTAIRHHRVPKNLRGFHRDNWGHYQSEAARHFRDDDDDRHEHSHFYGRREAHEQHRPVRWREHEDHDDHDRHGKKEKHDRDQHGRSEKHEKRDKHDRDD